MCTYILLLFRCSRVSVLFQTLISHLKLELERKTSIEMNTIKCVYLFLSLFYAVLQSDDFVLLAALRPAGTHLPGLSEAVDTLTEVTCTQRRTKP